MNSKAEKSAFERGVDQANRLALQVRAALEDTERCLLNNKMESAYDKALTLAEKSERLTLLARTLPAYTGHPAALDRIDEMIEDIIAVKIGFTKEGWFYLSIPALLPKKGKGSPSYIRAYLYPAMGRFFKDKTCLSYPKCVLILRHVYHKDRPERQYRDHDNIELNMVADIVALYTMKDDHPLSCAHFYCSAAGADERTEVFVVPRDDFMKWLRMDENRHENELIIYENRP